MSKILKILFLTINMVTSSISTYPQEENKIIENQNKINIEGKQEKIIQLKEELTNRYSKYIELDTEMYAIADVCVRNLPNVKGEKLGYLRLNEKIKVIGQCKNTSWYKVEYKGQEAFIRNDYLTETIPTFEEKVIYLTFDDGPSKYTPRLLEILNEYDIKATFFVVGTGYSYLIKDIYENGHTIGLHSATHSYKTIYANEEAYYKDLYKIQDIVFKHTGTIPTIIRFPGGSSNKVSIQYNEGIMTRLTESVEENGFEYFDWNVGSGDTDGLKDTESVVNQTIKLLQKYKTSIVLQHDSLEYSVEAVDDIIEWALENGYTFKTLDMESYKAHHKLNN